VDAKTERLIAAIRASALTPPPPTRRDLAEIIAAKKAELEAAGLLPLFNQIPPRRTP
jgi:hypothetical protein